MWGDLSKFRMEVRVLTCSHNFRVLRRQTMKNGPRLLLLVIALAFCFTTTRAHADVIYTFTGTNDTPGADGLPVAFQYTAATFLTATPPPFFGTSISLAELDSCTNCNTTNPNTIVFEPNNVVGDTIDFADINNIGTAFAFSFGAFANPGTYHSTSPFNTGTLTVTVVPEPNSIIFSVIGAGLIFGFIALRRRMPMLAIQQ
jgi:hypothetical protein